MTKTAVGGFDGFDPRIVFGILTLLAALGVLPKGWSKMIGTASGLATLYTLARKAGLM